MASLKGNETLQVLGLDTSGRPAASTQTVTTAQIAALGSAEAPFVSTAITTVGNGVLTAAGLVGGQINRSGPTANFTDTTDTAAAIIAALPAGAQSVLAQIKNGNGFTMTIAAGSGVTLPATVLVPPFSVGKYQIVVTSSTAVQFIHLETVPIAGGQLLTIPAISTLNTVGAGTLLAASFVGGIISRGGSQSGTAFTDTTDTAAAIVAACANLANKVGTAMIVEYANTTNATATITGGSGVTVSGVSVIPPNTISQFLLTYTAATPTVTMVGTGVTQNIATSVNILGSSTGSTALQSANAGTSNYTLTLPAQTDTIAVQGATTPNAVLSSTLSSNPNNAVTVASNAGTCPVTTTLDTFTNSSAATMTITLATAGAADGQKKYVRVYDFSAASQTITWVNTENGEGTAPTTSNGSTTLPKTAFFMYNGATSKWRCIIS